MSFDPTPAAVVPRATGWARALLYLDAMKSFWRDWVVSYDAGQQQMLGQEAVHGGREWMRRAQVWYRAHYQRLLTRGREVSESVSHSPQRWGGGAIGAAVVVLLLANIGRLWKLWMRRKLAGHPADSPRLAASLWYERMTTAVGKRGWKKAPAQTPREFLGSIGDHPTREKVAEFTLRYEGARFGESKEDAERLPELYEEIRGAGRR